MIMGGPAHSPDCGVGVSPARRVVSACGAVAAWGVVKVKRAAKPPAETCMDKKAKKRTDLLNQRLQKLRQQLSGARRQMDDPQDVARLEREIEQVSSELEKLKQSG